VLNDWFGTATSKTDELLFKNFQTTSLFSDVVRTISSGAWHNPAVWTSGRVPTLKDVVRISKGHVLEVGSSIQAKDLKVEIGAELKFLGKIGMQIQNGA
jgi:hypothetical protein